MAFPVNKIRKDFPNLHVKVHGKDLVYLDNAATTFKPAAVIRAIDRHYRFGTSNIHRGVHHLSEQATAAFEETRRKVGNFINASKPSEIIFTKGTTDAINLVASSYGRAFLSAGDEIIISAMEHHSNIVPWQMLCQEKGCKLKVIPMNDAGELDVAQYERMFTMNTKLVSVVYVSNSLGTVNPIRKLIDLAHKNGVPILIDGAQAVSHLPVDMQELNCDFFAFSAHKLFGPTGVGVLYGKTRWLEAMPPYQGGGDMIASVTFEKTTYNVLPHKFEAGTPNVADVIAFGAAIDYADAVGLDEIQEYEAGLLKYGTQVLLTVPGLRLIGTAQDKASILSFVLPDIHPHDLGTLVDQEGVAIRTGHHCTQPVMERFGIPATARASLAFYNTTDELDRLVDAIHKAQKVFR